MGDRLTAGRLVQQPKRYEDSQKDNIFFWGESRRFSDGRPRKKIATDLSGIRHLEWVWQNLKVTLVNILMSWSPVETDESPKKVHL